MTEVQSQLWLQTSRPWHALYGLRLNRRRDGDDDEEESCSRLEALPQDILYKILMSCDPYSLGNAACVCKHLLESVQNVELWKKACLDAWPQQGSEKIRHLLNKHYSGDWKRLWLTRPRLRFDGVYVSRNTYIKTGIVEWRTRNPVHIVLYYRYVRFFPDGRFLYKTTPETVSKVARRLRTMPKGPTKIYGEEGVVAGRYHFHHDLVYTTMVYPGTTSTEIRSKLQLRSTTPARNNRLDILALLSFSRESGNYIPMDPNPQAADEDDALSHKKGLSTYVFVPWHQVHTSVMNLGIDEMDYFCSG